MPFCGSKEAAKYKKVAFNFAIFSEYYIIEGSDVILFELYILKQVV